MAKHALRSRNEEHKVPGKDFLALHSNVKQTIGNLNVIDQGIYKTMDPEIYLKLDLHNIDALHNSICQRIIRQESLHPGPYTNPIPQLNIPVPEITWVNTPESVAEMVSMMADKINLQTASSYQPALTVDSEGSLALLQIMIVKNHRAFFIDVPQLGRSAFHTSVPTSQGDISLKNFLESDKVVKLLWDCRGDAAKLRDIVGVSMNCVHDVQLMDNATSSNPKDMVKAHSLDFASPVRLRKFLDDKTHHDWTSHKLFR